MVALGGAAREVEGQGRDVLTPLGERRQPDREDVQPVKEVAAEATGLDTGLEVPVGGGQDADVHLDLGLAPQPGDAVLLHRPQELALGRRRYLADLVEEQRAAVGLLETSQVPGRSTGERSPLMADGAGGI